MEANENNQPAQEEITNSVDSVSTEGATPDSFQTASRIQLEELHGKIMQTKQEIKKLIVGQEEMVDQILLGILSRGHVLIEGVPGIAKTLTAKIIARTLDVDFSRIQFTPDLMPSDVIGTSVFNVKTSEFIFKKGPVFSNLVLIDEINRAPAKTQAALFEVMEERQITFDGTTYKLEAPFFIVATQNPVEQEGTYRLPEAQLDRFLFRIKLNYPDLQDEIAILQKFKGNIKEVSLNDIQPILSAADIDNFHGIIEEVQIEDQLIEYIAKIVNETRNHARLYLGASPRASLSILKASKTMAAIRGRDFVTPDDIQYISGPVMNHRIILTAEAEMEGMTPEDVIAEIVQKIEVPR